MTKTLGAIALAAAVMANVSALASPTAKISPEQAKTAALKKIHGKATSAVYELEDGHWQYAVIVTNSKGMYEVAVSSVTGKVLSTEKTSAASEKTEAIADKKAAAKAHK